MVQPDTEIGVAKWCAEQCLDDSSPWCVQTCMQKMYSIKKPCMWTNGGECKRKYRSGTYYGYKSQWPASRTSCAYPIYRQENSTWADKENAKLQFKPHPKLPSQNCPPSCAARPEGESFWDAECENEPTPSKVDHCRDISQGDEDVYERCLNTTYDLPKDDYKDELNMWSPVYDVQRSMHRNMRNRDVDGFGAY